MTKPCVPRSVPFFDFKAVFADDPDGYVDIFRRTLVEGGIILQKAVDDFESGLAKFLHCKHVVSTADCTNAMTIGLRAAGIGAGDEVIVCSHTFIATAQAVHFAGAKPVAVDVGDDRLVDVGSIPQAITSRTKAILVTQLNGRICDMPAVLEVAKKHGLMVAEDSAQALGATLDGQDAGTFGRFGAFSFYPSKLLGCFGDGGALSTDDENIAEKVYHMRNHGANRQKQLDMNAVLWATNSRLDNIQAAFLNYKLPKFRSTLARRRRIARTYQAAFEGLNDFGLPPGPDSDKRHFDVFQNYEVDAGERDALRQHLAENGVGTIIQWGGATLHRMRGLGFNQELPRTDRFFERCFMLPMNQYLSDEDVLHVCSSVRSFFGREPWPELAPEIAGDLNGSV